MARLCGQVLRVPIVEAAGHTGVGRFGWKDQHASLLSFSGDAYLNEMGITSRLFPDEVTKLCNIASEANNQPDPDGLDDVDHFSRFVRASKAPSRDAQLSETPMVKRGSELFDKIGCVTCHVRTLRTAPAGTKINGDTFTIPAALGEKTFHPFGDFLLHDVGTGEWDRHGDAGTLRAECLSDHVGGSEARQIPQLREQSAHSTAMGRPPAPAVDARWSVVDASRRHTATSGRSEPRDAAL